MVKYTIIHLIFEIDMAEEKLKRCFKASCHHLYEHNDVVCNQHLCSSHRLTLKPRTDVTKSPKQGYQWPHENDLCPPNFFLKILFAISCVLVVIISSCNWPRKQPLSLELGTTLCMSYRLNMLKFNVFTFFVEEFTFIRHQNRSCYGGRHNQILDVAENYDACDKWCIGNNACGGYNTNTYPSTEKRCTFKNKSCKDHIMQSNFIDTYISQGNTAK